MEASPGRDPGTADPTATRWPLAVWLLPSETDAPRWQATIDDLAHRHGSPPFAAHVTVHVGSCAAGCDPVPALQAAAARARAITLEAAATDASANYFKTLFVPLPGPAEGRALLERLRRQLVIAWLASGSGTPATEPVIAAMLAAYKLEPHLSLLYARIDPAARAALARAHDTAGSAIHFDRLAFVKPGPGHDDLAEVDGWQVFGHCRLGGPVLPGASDRQEPAGIRS
jgi:hypothetical protein